LSVFLAFPDILGLNAESFCFWRCAEASCWMWTGERQSAKIRAKYLRGIMRQNVGYFDNESTSTSEVVNSVSADTMVVQEAISEKVSPPNFQHPHAPS
jgi:ATP-binding cassette subfamily B (MDR/TAP) protein 1